MAVLDFDLLCASMALAVEGRKGASVAAAPAVAGEGGGGGIGGGVQRMWKGDVVLDCLKDRRIALEAACCPRYRFGKNMRRANLGSCFLQTTPAVRNDNRKGTTYREVVGVLEYYWVERMNIYLECPQDPSSQSEELCRA